MNKGNYTCSIRVYCYSQRHNYNSMTYYELAPADIDRDSHARDLRDEKFSDISGIR